MYNILNTSIYRYIIIYYYPLIALKDPYFCLNKLGGIRIIRLCEAPKFPYLFWGNQLKNITEFPQFLGTNPKKKHIITQHRKPSRKVPTVDQLLKLGVTYTTSALAT